MRRITFITLVISMVLSLTINPAFAGDKEDLKARIVSYHEVWNAKDAATFATYFSSNSLSLTSANGNLFGDPLQFRTTTLDATVLAESWEDPDIQVNQTPRYIQVNIYGNGTVGVANYYRQGSQADAEGVITPVNVRVTDIWIKEGGQWRAMDRHVSQLQIGVQIN